MTDNDILELAKSHRAILFWGTRMDSTPSRIAWKISGEKTVIGLSHLPTSETEMVRQLERSYWTAYTRGNCLFNYGMPTVPVLEELAAMASNKSHELYDSVYDRGEKFSVVIDASFHTTTVSILSDQRNLPFAADVPSEVLATRLRRAVSKFVQIECIDHDEGTYKLRSMPA